MIGTPVRDRVFKSVILALLIFSILIQIMVSVWAYEKFKIIETRLSTYPVSKPVAVDVRGTIPQLEEIDRKIDKLAQGLNKALRAPQGSAVPKRSVEAGCSSTPVTKKTKPRKPAKSTQVEVIEKIGN